MFDNTGEIGPPWTAPTVVLFTSPLSSTPALRYARIRCNVVASLTFSLKIEINLS